MGSTFIIHRICIFLPLFAATPRGANLLYSRPFDDVTMLEERLKSPKDNEKVNALFDAAENGSAGAVRLILPFLTYANSYVSDRAVAAFSQAKDASVFVTIAKECLAKSDIKTKKAVLEALVRTRHSYPADLAEPMLKDADDEAKLLAIETYIQHPPPKAPAEIVKLASPAQKNNKARANALLALAKCEPASAGAPIEAAKKDKDFVLRVGALVASEAAQAPSDAAVAALGDPDRRVRLAALEWIEHARPGSAIPRLIQNLPKEAGRPRHATIAALKSLSLRDFGNDPAAWKNWYDSVGPNFTPPALPEDKDKPKGKSKKPANDINPNETRVDGPKYYDFIVESDRVAFLVDVSGSMRAKYTAPGGTGAGAGGEKTRLEHAADALRDVILQLPKGTRVSIIIFNSEPLRYHKGAKSGASQALEASAELAAEVHKFVVSIGASNTTNISDSLELVIDDLDVDTVYLLTDGAPSAGKRNLGSRIIEWAKRTTRLSRTEINTIGFGAKDKDADFLRDLAAAGGGKFSSK